MKLSTIMAALALTAMAAAPVESASAAQFVTNGYFQQTPNANSFAFGFNPTPQTLANDWTGSGDWVMFCSTSGTRCDNPAVYGYLAGPLPASPGGTNFVGIDGTPGFDGDVYQTINGLTVGKTYTLSFYEATAQECCTYGNTTTDSVTASLGSESFTTPTITTSNDGTTPWMLYSTTFTYTGGGNVLSFMNAGTGVPPYALIDGVSFTGVPEPGTWAMIVAGFAGLGLLGRARRKAAAVAA